MQSALAGSNIRPCRFVKIGTSTGYVLEADAGERVLGISQMGTRRSPYIDSNGYAASANEPIQYFDETSECPLELGGTVAAGDLLKSDNEGCGVTASTDADDYGAVALASGVSGEQIPVKVRIGERST